MEQDVLIIGGGAAGLSAAVALGRSRRSVTVLDAGSPRNAPAEGVHNFLTRDGTPPAELLALGRKEVEQYGGVIVSGEARHAQRIPGGFAVTADDGRVFTARRLLVTTGLTECGPPESGLTATGFATTGLAASDGSPHRHDGHGNATRRPRLGDRAIRLP